MFQNKFLSKASCFENIPVATQVHDKDILANL